MIFYPSVSLFKRAVVFRTSYTSVFSAYLDKTCEVEVVIDKSQTHDIERTNTKLNIENETNRLTNAVIRWIKYFVSLCSGEVS